MRYHIFDKRIRTDISCQIRYDDTDTGRNDLPLNFIYNKVKIRITDDLLPGLFEVRIRLRYAIFMQMQIQFK